METFIILLIIFVVGVAAWSFISANLEEKQNRKNALMGIAQRLTMHLDKVNNAKTLSSKINNCDKAIQLLSAARGYKEHREVIQNYDSLHEKIYSLKKVLPVVEELKKSHKNKFKGKDSAEKNNLLNALYEIETNNIRDEDFNIVDAYDDETGELVSKAMIEDRLTELGWER